MYHRDQHKNPSLSSYFDGKKTETASDSSLISSPVSPLATVTMTASLATKLEQNSEKNSG